MKKFLLSLFAVTLVGFSANAQYSIDVRESNESVSTGNHNALVVMIYENDIKDVEKGWKKALGKLGSSSTKKGEVLCDDCQDNKGMGENTFDVYSRVEEDKDGAVKLIVAVDLGGAYMNSGEHGEQFKWFKDYMREFAVEQTKEGLGNEVELMTKVLEELQGDQEDLEKSTEGLEKDIEDYKKKIEEAEKQIEENKKLLEEKIKEIELQQKVVEEIEAKEAAVK